MFREMENLFPNLAGPGYEITSEATRAYNCIAWALGLTVPWWGYENPGDYWPPTLPRNNRVDTIMRLFADEGYAVCNSDAKEAGYEKVAIYAFVGLFTHVARQLDDGQWSSKLGIREDITHPSPTSLVGGYYGDVHCIMRRPSP